MAGFTRGIVLVVIGAAAVAGGIMLATWIQARTTKSEAAAQ